MSPDSGEFLVVIPSGCLHHQRHDGSQSRSSSRSGAASHLLALEPLSDLPRLAAGLGIVRRADMFAAIDNTVVLPGYTRADVAAYYSFNEKWRLQANIENLFGTHGTTSTPTS